MLHRQRSCRGWVIFARVFRQHRPCHSTANIRCPPILTGVPGLLRPKSTPDRPVGWALDSGSGWTGSAASRNLWVRERGCPSAAVLGMGMPARSDPGLVPAQVESPEVESSPEWKELAPGWWGLGEGPTGQREPGRRSMASRRSTVQRLRVLAVNAAPGLRPTGRPWSLQSMVKVMPRCREMCLASWKGHPIAWRLGCLS